MLSQGHQYSFGRRLTSDRLVFVTAKEKLKATVESLSEAEAEAALALIVRRVGEAPVDDEPITPEEEAALAEVEADRAAGVPTVSFDEVKRKYGLA